MPRVVQRASGAGGEKLDSSFDPSYFGRSMNGDADTLLGFVVLVLMVVAAARAGRRWWRALLMILGWLVVGCAVGSVVGWFVAHSVTAFEGPFGQITAGAAAVSRIRSDNRKRRYPSLEPVRK